jgi:hypothetical protein
VPFPPPGGPKMMVLVLDMLRRKADTNRDFDRNIFISMVVRLLDRCVVLCCVTLCCVVTL